MAQAAPEQRWLLLIATQPTGNAAVRMRVWREIKSQGAAILRDGVYLLPARADPRAAFDALAQAVEAAGGSAHVLPVDAEEHRSEEWLAMFDRGAEYADLLKQVQQRAAATKRAAIEKARTACRELDEQFAALAATDYFAGAQRDQVQHALAAWRAEVERRASPGEPHAQSRSIDRLLSADYQGRVWATRRGLWVDRVACAWLIRRFIDREARFVWIARPQAKPKRAIGFDFDGAQFTHQSGRVSFEVLVASFGLEDDVALVRLGRIVHALDAGGVPQAEAAGIEAVLTGLRHLHPDDDAFLAACSGIFDACYDAFVKESPKENTR
jgi:hypothetical protein